MLQGGWRGDAGARRSAAARKLQRDQAVAELEATSRLQEAAAGWLRDAQQALDAAQARVAAGAAAAEAAQFVQEVRIYSNLCGGRCQQSSSASACICSRKLFSSVSLGMCRLTWGLN